MNNNISAQKQTCEEARNFAKSNIKNPINHDFIKIKEEYAILESFLKCYSNLKLKLYPIHDQLKSNDSIPDAIIEDNINVEFWVEIVTTSTSTHERQQVGKSQKGLPFQSDEGFIFNINSLENSLMQEICKVIYQKSKKRYYAFAQKRNIKLQGVLIISLMTPNILISREMLLNICDKLNKTKLISLDAGKSCFEQIILISHLDNTGPCHFLIADAKLMTEMRAQEQSWFRMKTNKP